LREPRVDAFRANRKNPAEAKEGQPVGIIGIGLVRGRIERRLGMVDAHRRQTFGDERAVKRHCESFRLAPRNDGPQRSVDAPRLVSIPSGLEIFVPRDVRKRSIANA